jgi:hypothetical protein
VTAPTNEQAFLQALEAIGISAKVAAVSAEDATDRVLVATDIPSSPATVTAKNLWKHPDAHPIALDLLLLRRYGHTWLEWEPETLQALIPEDFGSQVSDLNLVKIQACKTLHLVDTFWEQWEIFIACLMPFNNEFTDFNVMQVPTVAQVLVACDVAARIRDDVEWSSEMKAYVRVVYEHDGIFLPIEPAAFVTLDAPEEIDQKALAVRWNEVRSSGKAPTGANPMDEQLRRLLTVHGFLEESRTRLQRQLGLHA